MSTSIYLREERTFSLFGRDACSDAFGPNAMNSICAPSNTLCCVRRNQAFPSCQQYLGRGWCCVGEKDSDNCYVDGPSACDEPNAVPCTNLASGVDKACCPRLTSCHNDYKASLTQVRCNIRQIDLKNAARAETQSTSTTSTTSSTSTTSTTSTENVGPTGTPTISGTSANAASTSSPPSPPTEKGGVSGGVIAGAVVGPTFVLIALVLLGCFFWRRKKAKNANISSGGSYGTPNDAAPAPGMQQWVAQQQQYQQHYQQHPGPHGPTSAQSPLPPNYSTAPSYSDVAKPYPLSHSPPVSVGPDPYATAWNGLLRLMRDRISRPLSYRRVDDEDDDDDQTGEQLDRVQWEQV